jgi:glyoxylase-like metal-dependent hydrolase (beta-lactamase superfamily II)
MLRSILAVVSAVVSVLALLSCATGPSRHQGLVDKAIAAMGGADALSGVRTASVKGTLRQWEPEQSETPGGEMRFANEATFTTVTDRASRATRTDWVRNFAYPTPRTFTFSEVVTPDAGYVIGIDSNGRNAENMKASPPAHAMSSLRLATTQREMRRLAPGALLLEMRANPGSVQPASDITVANRALPAVSYGGFIVAFDPQTSLPARIRTLDYDYVWGDVPYDVVLSDWRDVGGVKVAHAFKYEFQGWSIAEGTLSEAQINGAVDTSRLEIPAAVRASASKPASGNLPYQWVIRRQFIGTYMDSDNVSYDTKGSPGLRLQDLAPGVSQLQGGTHHSLLVEMANQLVVFDAPIGDGQSKWVVEAAKAKYPGKPIRYVVLTHHHMDHSGGVRGFLAEGATLVVGQGAGAHWRRVLAAPWSRNPDLPARDLSGARIIEVADKYVISDSNREVVAYLMDSPHAKGSLLGYVPDAKLGFVTDIWSPGVPLPAKPNPGLLSVVNAVKKNGLQPERFAGGHGSTAPYSSLAVLAGQ